MLSNKERKRLYDIEYRRRNKEKIKARKKIYNESPEGRAMQKRARDKRKSKHLEYCQTDKYRDYKQKYDHDHRAKKFYGEYWECMQIVAQIEYKFRDLVPDQYQRNIIRGNIKRMMERRKQKRKAGGK